MILTKPIVVSKKQVPPKLVYFAEMDTRPCSHRHERLFRNKAGDLMFDPRKETKSKEFTVNCNKRKCRELSRKIQKLLKKAKNKFESNEQPNKKINKHVHNKSNKSNKVGTWKELELIDEIKHLKKLVLEKYNQNGRTRNMSSSKKSNGMKKQNKSPKKENKKSAIPTCGKCRKRGHSSKEHREGKGYLGKNFIKNYTPRNRRRNRNGPHTQRNKNF
jgi:hypothetical protein